ncbi:DUF2663 family protein [Bacillus taeanensis]|uniref:DUF2663 domain-containing protein n=1 Tax=Bacillus taeanensis TaxID=273032 RepID=A0A366XXM6_9BACI|nr:DUF2663 family protein [Bacillus taeanensis]RBW70318.1 hypothetical protein DS031_07040 [Bacillus taeanensis]
MEQFKEWQLKQLLVPEVALELLKTLVERKQKEEHYEKELIKWGITVFVFLLLGFIYICVTGLPLLISFSQLTKVLFDPIVWIIGAAAMFSYYKLNKCKKTCKKAEEEFEKLRLEIIKRTGELWSDEKQWESRHFVFEFMKSHFHINLYHE